LRTRVENTRAGYTGTFKTT